MVDIQELRFESGGKTYVPDIDKIVRMEGFSASDYMVNISNNAIYDGGSVAGKKILSRQLYIEIEESAANRKKYLGFFNPKKSGVLYITVGDESRQIGYEVYRFNPDLLSPPTIKIDLICPDPYFYDVDDFGKDIASRVALYAFPFIWLVEEKLISDYRVFTDQTLVMNKGDVETGLIIDFKCTGAVENPKIELVTTGKYMRILRTMEVGDEIRFETNTARKNIYVNGEKYTNFDPTSSFFSLQEGQNILKYNSDSGYQNLKVYIRYRAKYLGVV